MIKKLTIFCIVSFIISCTNDDAINSTVTEISISNSIFVNNGKILISGVRNLNNNVTTKFWIDNVVTDSTTFINVLKTDNLYLGSVDNRYRKTFINKTSSNEADLYSFYQSAFTNDNNVLYNKNNNIVTTTISNPGVLSAIHFFEGQPFFSGHLSEETFTEAGSGFKPSIPFFWDGNSSIVELPISQELFFRGTSCVFVDHENFYVGGKTSFPMYWKNTEMIKLGDLFGEVNQIILSEGKVYAVGFYNKNNSNSTGNTACYWVNGALVELEDDAQANGIYIDGNDIYVCGSKGNVPAAYRACYWKNGIRVDLPK